MRFAKYFFQQNYYRTLGRGVVFATSGRLGLGAGYGQDLLFSEKFLRRRRQQRARVQAGCARARWMCLGIPTGGNALLVFNEEMRFPMFWRFRGVGFFDAGNVFEKAGDLSFGGLRAGTGVGLRVVTPFALLRVDLGTPDSPAAGRRAREVVFLDRPVVLAPSRYRPRTVRRIDSTSGRSGALGASLTKVLKLFAIKSMRLTR